MKKTRKNVLRLAAMAAAVVMTAALPLSVKTASLKKSNLTAYAYSQSDFNYTLEKSNGITYGKYSDHAEIYDCDETITDLVIPEEIDGLPVTAIMRYAFQSNSLESITIPESVKTIGYYSFSLCKNLKSVKLPKSLEVMEMHAFELCSSLETVEFPDSFIEIHAKCFDETPWLKAQRNKDPLVVVNGALIDGRTAKGDIKVPSTVKYVSPAAFAFNEDITSAVFPSSVKKLCDNTFYLCTNLESVELNAVDLIDSMALGGCAKLTDLKISGNLEKIDGYAFIDTTTTATITFYGSKEKWDSVDKPEDDTFLKNAKMVFDESHSSDDNIMGDVNLDGAFNVSDLVTFQKWLLCAPDAELASWENADFCKDETLNAFDLCLMRRSLFK